MNMSEELRRLAETTGCAGFGVTSADPFTGVAETITHRRGTGLSGKLQFTYRQPEVAADVKRSLPWAKSLVVVSWSYLPEAGNPGLGGVASGRIARFATADHYSGLRTAVAALEQALQGEGWKTETLIDDDRLVDRAAAVRAGIGWWGKSSMVLDPRHGPWLLLGSVATDAELPLSSPMSRDCGTCDACIPACPTGAIVAPGVLDASRCLAHWLQVGGTIPADLREAIGDRIYGCDDCLDACPPGSKRLIGVATPVGRVDLLKMLATDDATLLETYGYFYIPQRRPRILRRNALVALANTTVAADAAGTMSETEADRIRGVFAGYLGNPDVMYRSHAAWGIGRIGGTAAAPLLRDQLRRERSQDVIAEIRSALSALETPEQ